ncbi:substrate-binding domain-containing protein [Humibacter ginsenosidimutans]|uniref:Sugar ABC transporter substrate-binding protein n=1 Tax=Humibacter ginsenosidimutans TaxID=2599293 RepID=A0A5B8M693_9MICO|nr:substrate-binding domain-containing protein [Humibacter ginsenosidimutans]QDZ15639.1 sugar ABC transporter substrate-binding protein [Humibacter ginsenosidimutans]
MKAKRAGSLLAVVVCALTLVGCSNAVSPGDTTHAAVDPAHATIGLLLPDSTNTRYESADRPAFEARIHAKCPGCTVAYQNASADAARQQQQAESMLAQGVAVLVLDAVDGQSAASIVNEATSKGVPVIAYDRIINSPDLSFFVSADNSEVGVLQAQALVDRLRELHAPAGSGILMVNGSPTDNNARLYKQGAHSVIDKSGYKVLAEYDTPDWAGSEAQSWVAGQITQFGSKIAGVYAANDGLAQGAIEALQAGGIQPVPPTTGQDAEIAAVQRILAGTQYMTVYKPIRKQAAIAADAALTIVDGGTPTGTSVTKAGGKSVPTVTLTPVSVTLKNVKRVVIDSGFHTVAQICTPAYASYCKEYGIT